MLTEPGLCPGVCSTSSVTSATSNEPPSSMSISGRVSPCTSRQIRRSLGCSATGDSSRSATSSAAPAWAAWPCVQITARISRSPTASSTARASAPGSTTITSSSSPITQALQPALPPASASSTRASIKPPFVLATDETTDRPDDQPDGDSRKQQPGDPREQLHAVCPQYPADHPGEPHGKPQQQGDRHAARTPSWPRSLPARPTAGCPAGRTPR